MAIKKRQVKRLMRKFIFLIMIIAFISLLTTVIVEKRLGKAKPSDEVDESNLDPNGDPITPQFRAAHVEPMRRQARPPFQDRNSVRDPEPDQQVEHPQPEVLKMFTLPTPLGERKDWHDYKAMEADKARIGLGEHGLPATIDPSERDLEQQEYRRNGFNGYLSDRISVNRSVPDVRKEA